MQKMNEMTIGANIARMRQNLGMTQSALFFSASCSTDDDFRNAIQNGISKVDIFQRSLPLRQSRNEGRLGAGAFLSGHSQSQGLLYQGGGQKNCLKSESGVDKRSGK